MGGGRRAKVSLSGEKGKARLVVSQKGKLIVAVEDVDGNPLADVIVMARGPGANGQERSKASARLPKHPKKPLNREQTDHAVAYFELEGDKAVPVGKYTVFLKTLEEQTKKDVDVAKGGNVDRRNPNVTLQLPPFHVVLWGYESDDKKDQPLDGKAWTLSAPVTASGTTGADGLVKILNLPPLKPDGSAYTQGTLKVTMHTAPAAAAAPPPAAADPPPYPVRIQPDAFKDPVPEGAKPEAQVVEWDLTVGDLKPFDSLEGGQARLHNLGFDVDVGSDAEQTKKAVQRYQQLYLKQDPGSGKLEDIKADLRDRHDNPA